MDSVSLLEEPVVSYVFEEKLFLGDDFPLSTLFLTLLVIKMWQVRGFPYQAILGHHLGILQFNPTLTLSPGHGIRFHSLKSQSCKTVPSAPTTPITSPPVLLAVNQEFPEPLLGFD